MRHMKQLINPAELPPPSGYSHGVLVDGVIHLGGQTALDENGRIVDGGIVPQFRQALVNVLTTLRAAGGQPGDLVSGALNLFMMHLE